MGARRQLQAADLGKQDAEQRAELGGALLRPAALQPFRPALRSIGWGACAEIRENGRAADMGCASCRAPTSAAPCARRHLACSHSATRHSAAAACDM